MCSDEGINFNSHNFQFQFRENILRRTEATESVPRAEKKFKFTDKTNNGFNKIAMISS